MQCLPRQQRHQISRSGLVRSKWGFHHVTSSMTSALVPVVGSVGSQASGDRLAEYNVAWKNSDIPSSANFRVGKSTNWRERQKCQNHWRNETEPSAKHTLHEILFADHALRSTSEKKLCSEIISQQLIYVVWAPDAKHWGVILFVITNIYPKLQLNVLYFLKTRSLSGKETRSLPGQETRSLPGQETRSLPGKETRKLPSLSTTHDNQRKWKKLARQTLLM